MNLPSESADTVPFRNILNFSRVLGKPVETIATWYLRLIPRTCRVSIHLPERVDDGGSYWPCILTTWHGQCYVLPFAMEAPGPITILVSRSKDGQILQRVLAPFGYRVIVGSGAGDNAANMFRNRSLAGFEEMLETLGAGGTVALTADVPKKAGVAGRGVVKLARLSGCPIVPMAVMTSHRYTLKNWDRTIFNLPIGRLAIVIGAPIRVENTKNAALLEAKRQEVQNALNALNAKARELVAYWRF